MRTYAPRDSASVLEALLEEPSMARGVVHHEVLPAREAVFANFPDWLDPRIVTGLAPRGIERPYSHQAEALEMARAGLDFVVVTPLPFVCDAAARPVLGLYAALPPFLP